MSAKKRKTFQYKEVRITNTTDTLQAMLERQILTGKPLAIAQSRTESVNGNGVNRVINHPTKYSGMLCGQLIQWEQNKSQETIALDSNQESYPMGYLQPAQIAKIQKNTSAQNEFLESALYFGLLDNHLVVMASSALKPRELETHLAWLLGVASNELPKDGTFILQDQPSKEAVEKLKKANVKSVMLGAPIEMTAHVDEGESLGNDEQEQRTTKVRYAPNGIGADLLSSIWNMLGEKTPPLTDALDDANLQVKLEITYSRATSKQGHKVLDSIAASLRHAHEDDVEIHLDGGGKIKGNEIKLSTTVNIATVDGKMEFNDIYHQMHDWLNKLFKNDDLNSKRPTAPYLI